MLFEKNEWTLLEFFVPKMVIFFFNKQKFGIVAAVSFEKNC